MVSGRLKFLFPKFTLYKFCRIMEGISNYQKFINLTGLLENENLSVF